MLLMFLTSVAVQINNNLDNVIIGAISGPALVTVYSMGLLIFGMYESISTSLSGVMLPTVTDLLERDEHGEKIQSLIVKVGRIQFLLLGAVAAGFACIGKCFIYGLEKGMKMYTSFRLFLWCLHCSSCA